MKRSEVLRILDANFNRSREGLRVCEEIARFVLSDEALTRGLKTARHAVSACLAELPLAELVAARDTRTDVGKEPSALERPRGGARDLYLANSQRAKESLRVLEETSKLFGGSVPARCKRIRFKIYELEKRALPKLEAVRDRRRRRGRGTAA
ncbi:MAG TPA: thiamine-phosphate pyrophosphorylase [Candidatus Eisenbacteria bacterium]|jgi:thiamine-phosphate pyrophosphorylase|nr:thiamine-phosphate pyrophosphorylase [Candidatus Eisenbacteria bacterium]